MTPRSELPADLDALIALALAAQTAAAGNPEAEDLSALIALHETPTEEVFGRAVALVHDADWSRRELGIRILDELGQAERPRPFAERALDVLLPILPTAERPEERRRLLMAIGEQAGPRALAALLPFAAAADPVERYIVAQLLPGCAALGSDDARCDERAIAPLLRLMADADGDVRFYATAAFESDFPTLTTPAIRAALEERLSDPDAVVRQAARNALETRSG